MGYPGLQLKLAQLHCIRIALAHYENFLVLSPATPFRYVPHIAALYAFSRHADDIADENIDNLEATKILDDWKNSLQNALNGVPENKIFHALIATVKRHNLPHHLLFDLLKAFKQDLTTTHYDTFESVRAYTRHSADPVGRLMLRIYGYDNPQLDALSDNICTGLQLANFLQDVGEDADRGRIYIPMDECNRFDVDPNEILNKTRSVKLEHLLHYQNIRAYRFIMQGLPLADHLKGRLQKSIRLFALGGLQILENLRKDPQEALYRRVTLNAKQKRKAVISSFRQFKQHRTPKTTSPSLPLQ
jgi:squalene synthase HpnC